MQQSESSKSLSDTSSEVDQTGLNLDVSVKVEDFLKIPSSPKMRSKSTKVNPVGLSNKSENNSNSLQLPSTAKDRLMLMQKLGSGRFKLKQMEEHKF